MINWILSSSALIVIVLIVRRLFSGKISFRLQYALWILVAIRLLMPINLGSSVLSIENMTNDLVKPLQTQEVIENDVVEITNQHTAESVKIYESIEEIRDDHVNLSIDSENPKESVKILSTAIFTGVWICGCIVFAMVFLLSNMIFSRKLKKSRVLLENTYGNLPLYKSAVIDTPCLFGIMKPAIYVKPNVAKNVQILKHAVYHEQSHYLQGDLIWAPIRCLCLILHWYNPLVWWAVKVSKQDGELACDELTIRRLGEEERISYGKTLIQLTCEKQPEFFLTATTMTSGKRSIRERIGKIAKAPRLKWYAFIGVLLVAVISVGCTFTGAQIEEKNEKPEESSSQKTPSVEPEEDEKPLADVKTAAEFLIDKANDNLRDGYVEAKLTYVDNAEVGWDYYTDNPWKSEAEREALAQAALKELYTLTGYNVTECTYTTDGRSRFIFGKNGDYIRKCIAFYSRDYGFMLCGDAVPYQGYMNARKFHYSDVQQLIGPLDGGVQEYEGGLSRWFLESSGVYCGEKIIAHEEINKDDTVYIHVKLMFEGGYYMVVIDKKLSSCSEVSGPYYEKQHSENIYYDEVQKDKVCLAVMPDGISGAGGDYRYIIPENQEEWSKAYHEMCKQATGDAKWKDEERSMGMWVVYNDEWNCVTDQGFLVHFEKRTNIEDAKEFYAACLNEANNYGIMNPMRPEDFKNLTAVKLVTEDGTYSLTEQLGVFEIQKAFSSSTELRGGAGCPFTAMMECTFEDGTTRTIYLATDSCDTWLSSGVYYQNPGFENIEELQSYFSKHGIKE